MKPTQAKDGGEGMIRHKSTAVVCAQMKITNQFRYLIRLAVACDAAGVAYNVKWHTKTSPHSTKFLPIGFGTHEAANRAWLEYQPRATITVTADKIPTAKALPKAPPERKIADWKPRFHEAEYKLDAYHDGNGPQPGFVIAHSSGLSLVCPSSTGEWGDGCNWQDADPNGKNWRVTHTISGRGFGVELTLVSAAKALMLAASFDVDWALPPFLLTGPTTRVAHTAVRAQFGTAAQKSEIAKRRAA